MEIEAGNCHMSIEVRNIHKRFGNFVALNGVNLEVKEGELVALLGPSGSGKTTLLRIIAGLEYSDPAPGAQVLFNGEDVTQRNAGARRVGFVFQHYALFRNMTVFENIAFGLRVRPRRSASGKPRPSEKDIRARVTQLLDLISLTGMAERYPSQLSGGQRQRVALARALAIEPKVLLLDEPFGALDAKVRKGLRQWLRRLHDEIHVTSILVTHDQEEALEVAERVVIMEKGSIAQFGTPDEVFHHPASEFVMDFLGSVNLFHGRIESGKAVFGPLVLDQGSQAHEGAPVRLFVRPYELEIGRDCNGKSGLRARVLRVQRAGAQVRVELSTEAGEQVNVDVPHERFQNQPIDTGEQVFVSVRDAHVFVNNGYVEKARKSSAR
jgi:sulfate transport system ATP-binding protein